MSQRQNDYKIVDKLNSPINSCSLAAVISFHWEMAHVNVLQTLVLEHRELAELNNNRMLCVCVGGGHRVVFTLCKNGAQRRPFLVSTTIPLWHVGCFNLYFLSSKSFVFNIMSLNIITDSNLATRNNLYPAWGSLTSWLRSTIKCSRLQHLSSLSSFHVFHLCITMPWYLKS